MIFMLLCAFDVVVRCPCHPGDYIDCIISRLPLIHGIKHIWSAASSSMAASTTPAAASLSFAPSSMTTKPIWLNHCCACGGVFVVLFVIDDKDDMNSFMLRLQRRLCYSFRHRWQRGYEFIHVVPAAVSLLFTSSLMTTKTIRIQSCWQPTYSSFHRIVAVERSTLIVIDSLTIIVVSSALVIQRTFAFFCSDVPPYASLWVW